MADLGPIIMNYVRVSHLQAVSVLTEKPLVVTNSLRPPVVRCLSGTKTPNHRCLSGAGDLAVLRT